jgi:SAM-dependent methyltransferase
MSTDPDTYDQRYTDYQAQRSGLRKWIRGFYLRSAARLVTGPTIDFGCGIGEFLRLLPAGSTGLEINQATVDFCRRQGLDVEHYDADVDDWSLSALRASGRQYRSIAISHVLEHLHDPVGKLNALLRAARPLGVERALVIVPGRSGYASDATHLTFVDRAMLEDPRAVEGTPFVLGQQAYFPGNLRAIGDHFTHHELRAVYVAPPATPPG